MDRLSNRSIAEQAAMFTGVVILLISLLWPSPGVGFACGFATVFMGVALSLFSSLRGIPSEKRLLFVIAGAVVESALVAMVCYVVWDYTGNFGLFVAALAGAGAIYSSVYWIVLCQLLSRRQAPQEITEPADARESPN